MPVQAAAAAAESAATRVEADARTAAEAANHSRQAAELTRKSATHAADIARIAAVSADGDAARAGQDVSTAERAERTAHDRLQDGEHRSDHEEPG